LEKVDPNGNSLLKFFWICDGSDAEI